MNWRLTRRALYLSAKGHATRGALACKKIQLTTIFVWLLSYGEIDYIAKEIFDKTPGHAVFV